MGGTSSSACPSPKFIAKICGHTVHLAMPRWKLHSWIHPKQLAALSVRDRYRNCGMHNMGWPSDLVKHGSTAKFGPFLVERRDNMLQATYALGQVRLKAGKWALGSLCRKPVFSNRDVVQSCPRKSHSPNLRCSRAGWGPTAKPLALLSTLLAQTVMETGGFPFCLSETLHSPPPILILASCGWA